MLSVIKSTNVLRRIAAEMPYGIIVCKVKKKKKEEENPNVKQPENR